MVRALLVVVVVAAGCGAAQSANEHFDYDWECQPVDASRPVPMTCTFRGTSGSGFVCGEVVVVCGSRRHRAKLCSGMLDPQQMHKRSVTRVTPAIADPSACTIIRFHPEVTQ